MVSFSFSVEFCGYLSNQWLGLFLPHFWKGVGWVLNKICERSKVRYYLKIKQKEPNLRVLISLLCIVLFYGPLWLIESTNSATNLFFFFLFNCILVCDNWQGSWVRDIVKRHIGRKVFEGRTWQIGISQNILYFDQMNICSWIAPP